MDKVNEIEPNDDEIENPDLTLAVNLTRETVGILKMFQVQSIRVRLTASFKDSSTDIEIEVTDKSKETVTISGLPPKIDGEVS